MKYDIDFSKFSPLGKRELEDMTPLQIHNFVRSFTAYAKPGGKFEKAVSSGFEMDSDKLTPEEYLVTYNNAVDAKKTQEYKIGNIGDFISEGQKKWTKKRASGIAVAFGKVFEESEEEYESLKEKGEKGRTGREQSRFEELEEYKQLSKNPKFIYGSKKSRKDMFLDLFAASGGIIKDGPLTSKELAKNAGIRSDLEKYIY